MLVMLGLGNWVDKGKNFKFQITQFPLFLCTHCLQISSFCFFVLVDSPQS